MKGGEAVAGLNQQNRGKNQAERLIPGISQRGWVQRLPRREGGSKVIPRGKATRTKDGRGSRLLLETITVAADGENGLHRSRRKAVKIRAGNNRIEMPAVWKKYDKEGKRL